MKCGIGIIFNNETDSNRLERLIDGDDKSVALPNGVDTGDLELWQGEMRLADLIEPLGFDAVFAYEHHFSGYVQHPDPLQWLAYMAGRTERIGVGTMLLVIPWHNPIRVAEQLVQLQYMLGDRDMKIGMGRGLGIREYAGLGIPMTESKGRFFEAIKIIQTAIREESFQWKGEFFEFPDQSQRAGTMSLRPRPLNPEKLLDSLYGGWLSPTTYPEIAKLGLKPILLPNVSMDTFTPQLGEFAAVRAATGLPPATSVVTNAFGLCADGTKERDNLKAMVHERTPNSAEFNYEFKRGYRENLPGYEFYGFLEKMQQQTIVTGQAGLSMDNFVKTPDEWIEEINTLNEMFAPLPMEMFVFTPNRLSLPHDIAEKSMRLFAKEVLPHIHSLEVKQPAAPAEESAPIQIIRDGVAATGPAGTWAIRLKSPMGEMAADLKLEVDGSKLSGRLVSGVADVELTEGTIDGDSLAWTAKTLSPMEISMAFTATIDGDSISGDAKFGDLGDATFEGKRTA